MTVAVVPSLKFNSMIVLTPQFAPASPIIKHHTCNAEPPVTISAYIANKLVNLIARF